MLAGGEPARQGDADAEDRGRRHAGADASHGLEPLVRPLRRASPIRWSARRPTYGRQRHGRRGIPIRQHRRLLANASPNARHNDDPLRVGPLRDAQGNILPNRYFPDMKALTDYIHAKGLKAGIYTSPGPFDCAGFAGSYQHEAQDARQFADWGFDFLKYDWCSYGQVAGGDKSLAALQKPYKLMGDLLKQQHRDIVFNLCQYGMGNVWEWGAEVGGHSWRTAGDLGLELNRDLRGGAEERRAPQVQPSPAVGTTRTTSRSATSAAAVRASPSPARSRPTEQYAFMSLWCLMASPLFYSGDMGRLDEFTLNVLCNPEVIEVDQDPLGQCARVVPLSADTFLMVKDLEDTARLWACATGASAADGHGQVVGPWRGGKASRSRSLASKGPGRFSAWVLLARRSAGSGFGADSSRKVI